jgi:hypothetical protein
MEHHLVEVRRLVEPLVERAFQHDAGDGRDHEGNRQRREKRDARARHQHHAGVAAQHRVNAPCARLTKFIRPIVTESPMLMTNSRLP